MHKYLSGIRTECLSAISLPAIIEQGDRHFEGKEFHRDENGWQFMSVKENELPESPRYQPWPNFAHGMQTSSVSFGTISAVTPSSLNTL